MGTRKDPSERFLSRLQEAVGGGRPIVLDGATGTELNRRGVDTRLPLWSARALIEAPDVLERIHGEFVEAGAEIVTTNTFRTHRRSLARGGLGDRAGELTEKAVGIARRAAAAADGGTVLVAGSMAPLEDCYSPDLVPDDEELEVEHVEMAGHLAAAGVDLILVETMNRMREAVAATRAATATGRPTVVSLICDQEGRLLSGESVADAVGELESIEPDALGINCTSTPHLHRALTRLRDATSRPAAAYGNIGYADDVEGWVTTDAVDPRAYAGYARRWRELGAAIVGGCCGTTPEHVAALARTL